MYLISCFFMIVSSAVCSVFAFIDLLAYGTPFMGIILFTCGVCFTGGWAAIAKEFCDE
jgi:hypothetical protein